MDPRFRQAFNAAYSPALYAAYGDDLVRRIGGPVGFRLAETPVFAPRDFAQRCERAALEIVAQLSEPERLEEMEAAVPERYRVPGRTSLPTFAALDFACVHADDGTLEPRLVELQGFPSLVAFETMQGDAWEAALAGVPGCGGPWTSRFGLSRAELVGLTRDAILGGHDPEDVVLLDLEPQSQKTACDFFATERLFGVRAIDPRDLTVRDGRFYRRDERGRERPVLRIYNRLIADELERKGVTLPFDPRSGIDVEWSPHPDWFWIWSKHSLPYLDHPAVPKTTLLSDLVQTPEHIEADYVLKPLFSFAGGGVNVRPTAGDVAAIAPAARANWCLQERIHYGGVLEAPGDAGGVKVEMRVMLLRRDADAALRPAINLCRLARGEMHGVDYNRDMTWTGSSIALWPA